MNKKQFNWKEFYEAKKADPKMGPLMKKAKKDIEKYDNFYTIIFIHKYGDEGYIQQQSMDSDLQDLIQSERYAEREEIIEKIRKQKDRFLSESGMNVETGVTTINTLQWVLDQLKNDKFRGRKTIILSKSERHAGRKEIIKKIRKIIENYECGLSEDIHQKLNGACHVGLALKMILIDLDQLENNE